MLCVVVTPLGPGHGRLLNRCKASVSAAQSFSKGAFRSIQHIVVDDSLGALGRSTARNEGVQRAVALGADWIFFLDADDTMVPEAFQRMHSALGDGFLGIWGTIFEKNGDAEPSPRPRQESIWSFTDLINSDPYLSIQMGHFVKSEIAVAAPFEETLDCGEDFDYYLRIWCRYPCIKLEEPLFVNHRGRSSIGPRSASGRMWRLQVDRLIDLSKCGWLQSHPVHRQQTAPCSFSISPATNDLIEVALTTGNSIAYCELSDLELELGNDGHVDEIVCNGLLGNLLYSDFRDLVFILRRKLRSGGRLRFFDLDSDILFAWRANGILSFQELRMLLTHNSGRLSIPRSMWCMEQLRQDLVCLGFVNPLNNEIDISDETLGSCGGIAPYSDHDDPLPGFDVIVQKPLIPLKVHQVFSNESIPTTDINNDWIDSWREWTQVEYFFWHPGNLRELVAKRHPNFTRFASFRSFLYTMWRIILSEYGGVCVDLSTKRLDGLGSRLLRNDLVILNSEKCEGSEILIASCASHPLILNDLKLLTDCTDPEERVAVERQSSRLRNESPYLKSDFSSGVAIIESDTLADHLVSEISDERCLMFFPDSHRNAHAATRGKVDLY